MPPAPELISPAFGARRPPHGGWPSGTSRGKERLFLAEGPQAVREAVATGAPAPTALAASCSPPSTPPSATPTSSRTPAAPGARVHLADDDVIADISTTVTPQGLVGICRFLDTPFDDVLAARPRLVAVLAHVRDPGNAGTVLRCADAAGADAVVLTDASVDLYNPKAVRASVGSLFHLPVAVGVPVERAIAGAQGRGRTHPRRRRRGRARPRHGARPRHHGHAPPPGSSATRRGGSPSRPARSPTPSYASRSTATPRA